MADSKQDYSYEVLGRASEFNELEGLDMLIHALTTRRDSLQKAEETECMRLITLRLRVMESSLKIKTLEYGMYFEYYKKQFQFYKLLLLFLTTAVTFLSAVLSDSWQAGHLTKSTITALLGAFSTLVAGYLHIKGYEERSAQYEIAAQTADALTVRCGFARKTVQSQESVTVLFEEMEKQMTELTVQVPAIGQVEADRLMKRSSALCGSLACLCRGWGCCRGSELPEYTRLKAEKEDYVQRLESFESRSEAGEVPFLTAGPAAHGGGGGRKSARASSSSSKKATSNKSMV